MSDTILTLLHTLVTALLCIIGWLSRGMLKDLRALMMNAATLEQWKKDHDLQDDRRFAEIGRRVELLEQVRRSR